MMKLYQKNPEIHHLSILEYQIFHLSMYQASKLYKNGETLPKAGKSII